MRGQHFVYAMNHGGSGQQFDYYTLKSNHNVIFEEQSAVKCSNDMTLRGFRAIMEHIKFNVEKTCRWESTSEVGN